MNKLYTTTAQLKEFNLERDNFVDDPVEAVREQAKEVGEYKGWGHEGVSQLECEILKEFKYVYFDEETQEDNPESNILEVESGEDWEIYIDDILVDQKANTIRLLHQQLAKNVKAIKQLQSHNKRIKKELTNLKSS